MTRKWNIWPSFLKEIVIGNHQLLQQFQTSLDFSSIQDHQISLLPQKASQVAREKQKLILNLFLESIIIILLFKSELNMQKQRENKRDIENTRSLQKYALESVHSGPNLLQSSRLFFSERINLDTFSCLNSFYFKDSSTDQHNSSLLLHFQRKSSQQYSYFQDQSQVPVLSFGRGYSEEFQPFEREPDIGSFKLNEQSKINDTLAANTTQCLHASHAKDQTERDQSGQDLQSNSINSQSNIKAYSSQSQQYQSTGLLVKNVTKNMGKLLFKYIWKNRNYLKGVMDADAEVWQKLMHVIRGCKSQNNVTRQFLISRFHSQGEQFRVFRVLAHHFFRKHCLAAVFRSKIKAKRVHFERIKKFDQALTNVRALDYLA